LFNIYYDDVYDDFVIEYFWDKLVDLICERSSELVALKKEKKKINYPIVADFDNLWKLTIYKIISFNLFNFFRGNKTWKFIIFK